MRYPEVKTKFDKDRYYFETTLRFNTVDGWYDRTITKSGKSKNKLEALKDFYREIYKQQIFGRGDEKSDLQISERKRLNVSI